MCRSWRDELDLQMPKKWQFFTLRANPSAQLNRRGSCKAFSSRGEGLRSANGRDLGNGIVPGGNDCWAALQSRPGAVIDRLCTDWRKRPSRAYGNIGGHGAHAACRDRIRCVLDFRGAVGVIAGESGLRAIVELVLGDHASLREAAPMDMLWMQRTPSVRK